MTIVFLQGCHTVITDWLIGNSAVLVGVAGGIACFGVRSAMQLTIGNSVRPVKIRI